MGETVTDFERSVLLAFGEVDSLPIRDFADQLENLTVSAREGTGAGQFIYFKNTSVRTNSVTAVISGVNGVSNDGSDHIGFLLFIDDGLIDALEGFSYEGDWPQDISSYRIVLESKPATHRRAT
jgi:hypothetical protein